jgi:hypothetical protein
VLWADVLGGRVGGLAGHLHLCEDVLVHEVEVLSVLRLELQRFYILDGGFFLREGNFGEEFVLDWNFEGEAVDEILSVLILALLRTQALHGHRARRR